MKLILTLAGMAIGIVVRGWVFAKLWGWFVVPLGVRPIDIAWAYGLVLAGAIFSGHMKVTPKDMREKSTPEEQRAALIADPFVTLVLLLIAWLAHRWMP